MSRRQSSSPSHAVAVAVGLSLAWAATTAHVSADPAKGATPPIRSAAGSVGFAPDPPVSASTRTYRYAVRAKDGAVSVDKPKLITHASPVATPRNLGRFALELYVGRELLERHRFDLPLLDELPRKHAPDSAPDFARHASARVFVDLPDLDRATYAMWVDRATGAKRRIFWPPADDFVPIPIRSASAALHALPGPSASAAPGASASVSPGPAVSASTAPSASARRP